MRWRWRYQYNTRNNIISQCTALHNIPNLYPSVPSFKEKDMALDTREETTTTNMDLHTLKQLPRMYEASIPIREICEQLGINEKTARALLKLLHYRFDE
jgi:hypothetical protein